jgi:hypothetical protein
MKSKVGAEGIVPRCSAPARQEDSSSRLHHRIARLGEGDAMVKAGGEAGEFIG